MKINKQSGQVLFGTAVAMFVLAGFAGLAIDMGYLRYQKRLQQSAADAAAIAGADNLVYASGVTTGARNASSQNGFTDTDSGGGCTSSPTIGCVSVAVNNPPLSGAHTTALDSANASKYVEVVVTQIQPTYFMKVVGINSEPVVARAVATNMSGGNTSGCLYTLGPPTASIEGVNANGAITVVAPKCSITDNGNYNTHGNSLSITASSFGVAGNQVVKGGGGTVTCVDAPDPTNCPVKSPPLPDPVAKLNLSPPCSPCTGGTSVSINGSGSFSIPPGTYTSISIQGAGGGNSSGCTTTGPNVTFQPGNYVFTGAGLNITGNAVISGTGVFFYFTGSSSVSITGNPDVNFTAPSTGAYSDILMWQDANDTNTGPFPNGPTFGGDGCSNYSGTLYFPSDQITFYGNSSTSSSSGPTYAVVVSDSLAFSGSPTVNLIGVAGLPTGASFLKHAILVE